MIVGHGTKKLFLLLIEILWLTFYSHFFVLFLSFQAIWGKTTMNSLVEALMNFNVLKLNGRKISFQESKNDKNLEYFDRNIYFCS